MSSDREGDFSEYFAVYLPAAETLATLGEWLTRQMPTATLSDDGAIVVARRTQAPTRLRATLDGSPAIRAEVIERAKRGGIAVRRALRPVMQRLDLEVADDSGKFEDLYEVFRALVARPGAVGVVESDADNFIELFAGESEEPLGTIDMAD